MRYYCNICKADITKAECIYSINKFDRPLCRKHQDIERKINSTPVKEEQPIYQEPELVYQETELVYQAPEEEILEEDLDEEIIDEDVPKSRWKSIVKTVAVKSGKGIVKGIKKLADYSKKKLQIRKWKDSILRRMTMNQLKSLCFQNGVSTKKSDLKENRSGEMYWKERNCTKLELISRLKYNAKLEDIIVFAKRNHINIRDILSDINRKKTEWKVKEITEQLSKIGSDPLLELEKAIREFIPHRHYDKEFYFQDTLASYLKAKFEDTEIEVKRGSTRPDIVVEDVAIEVKGPTRDKDLQTIADKCLRYRQHFPNGMICVLFSVYVSKQRYDDWLEGMKRNYPDVKVIRIYNR